MRLLDSLHKNKAPNYDMNYRCDSCFYSRKFDSGIVSEMKQYRYLRHWRRLCWDTSLSVWCTGILEHPRSMFSHPSSCLSQQKGTFWEYLVLYSGPLLWWDSLNMCSLFFGLTIMEKVLIFFLKFENNYSSNQLEILHFLSSFCWCYWKYLFSVLVIVILILKMRLLYKANSFHVIRQIDFMEEKNYLCLWVHSS